MESGEVQDWEFTSDRLTPSSDERRDAAAPLALPGRGTRELFPIFNGMFPHVVPVADRYAVMIEALTSKDEEAWSPICPSI